MRRFASMLGVSMSALLLFAAGAHAAVPIVSSPAATDIQGVSALLKGEVDPQGLATSYRFEYVDEAGFAAQGFAGATTTPAAAAGSDSAAHPARAAIVGLAPDTTYRYRLLASNSSGPAGAEGTFSTTDGFGFLPGTEGLSVRAIADGGGTATQAGSHPYELDLSLGLRVGGEFEDQPGVAFPDGDLRDLDISLPAGLILNPSVLNQCSAAAFSTPRSSPFEASQAGENCPVSSQIGTAELATAHGGGEIRRFGLFNLTPPPGVAAQIGFAPYGAPVVFDLALPQGADGTYALTLQARNFPQTLDLHSLSLSLWGTPWVTAHDGERGDCLNEVEPAFPWGKCSVATPASAPPLAYLSLPARCAGPLSVSVSATAWQQPAERSAQATSDAGGEPAPLDGCSSLHFKSSSEGTLSDKKASSPAGYNFRLENEPESLVDPNVLLAPSTKKMVVSLPPGVSINPSVGAGLGTCSPGQYAAETALSAPGQGCPNGSKLGDFSVRSPLFPGLFEGAIYLATPDDPATTTAGAENPFDSLVAVYLVAKLPSRGIQIKLAGRIDPDPVTGNLTATFDGLPQIPYTDLDLTFRTGQRAFLITPSACGPANTQIEMTSWVPELPSTHSSSSSPIETGIGGGPCPSGGAPPFAPGAVAGAVNSNVGSYTPYFVHLSRKDTEQEITSYSLVLPKGVTGKLAGIPFCSDATIQSARGKQGFAEIADPSCPAASQVGRTLTGYGVGGALTYAPGRIYLAGPYHGAPLSLVTIDAATVGPFDLGTIVIRSAFQIDPLTAQLRIDSRASDPIPHILDGIPLHLRDIRIYMDRPEFTHNPSSCEPSALESTLTGSGASFSNPADDSTATATSPFQLLNCLTLGFRPKLGIRLRGGSKRGDYPSLRATFVSRGARDSNLKRIEVTMPHSEFLAQEHIRKICTRPQFETETCPPTSAYGHAVAYTPLFDEPLRGDVYLRSSTHHLPDLVASLRSGAIRIVIEGKIGAAKQGIRVLFDNLPDAPIDRFTMTLNGGKRGLLVNSANICAAPPLATVSALGQNNVGASFSTELRGQCRAKAKRTAKAKHPKRGGR
jgi:hypothetical protein